MTLIKKSKAKIVNAEEPDNLFAIGNVKMGAFDKLRMKISTKNKSSNIVWGEVLNAAKKWIVNADFIKDIINSFDEKTLKFTKNVDKEELSKCFYLS